MSKYPFIKAAPISYGSARSLASIKYIVIHYTGNNGDTAKGNCQYFKRGATRPSGAHFFADQSGAVYQSVELSRTAWSVGGFFTQKNGAGSYYKKCINSNSVSIECCDLLYKDPSQKMTAAVRDLVAWIQSQCPNAKTVIRHWDVNGKSCPARMTGTNNATWLQFLKAIRGGSVAPAPQPAPAAPTSSGKTLSEIAKEVMAGKWGNGATRKKKLQAAGYDYNMVQNYVNAMLKGQVTGKTITYTVQRGDTLGSIAKRYGTTVSKIAKENNISDVNKIRVAQILKITL